MAQSLVCFFAVSFGRRGPRAPLLDLQRRGSPREDQADLETDRNLTGCCERDKQKQ